MFNKGWRLINGKWANPSEVKFMKKTCWIAKHYNKGWRLGFCVGNKPAKWIDVWFKDQVECQMALENNIVFVHMAKDGSQ